MARASQMLQARKKRRNLPGQATLVIVEGQAEEKYFTDLAAYYRSLSTFVLRDQVRMPFLLSTMQPGCI